MIDPRIYRAAFAPVLVALVVLMFSVEPIPEPVQAPETFAADFDGRRAATTARQIVEEAPVRTPGSDGDHAIADLVAARFGAISAGKLSEQAYEGSFDGEDVELRNVLLTLPGNSPETIVVVAGRDSARGAGATSSAAATGVLLEMAAELGRTSHTKTIVLLSAGGASDGASGMREFISGYPTLEAIEAVVVVSQPGVAEQFGPHLLPWATEPKSSSSQLIESAKLALAEESGDRPGLGGFLGNLFRLAIPAGLGGEAVAISEGLDAIGISAAGERPPDPASDDVASLADESMSEFGNTALALVLALDAAPAPLEHGPAEHLTLAGNLIPGWALGLLALTLLLPALVAAVDGIARASRRGEPVLGSLLWALSRALPFVALLVLAYLLALVGLAPDPDFPFDPGRFDFGWRAVIVFVLLLAGFAGTARLLGPLMVPSAPRRETLATALGLVAGVAVLGLWMRNPYLGLLCVPLAHVWLLGARPKGAAGPPATLVAVLAALIPIGAAVAHLAERLDLGLGTPWTLLLMVTGGQVGTIDSLLGSLLAGSLLGLLAVSLPSGSPSPREPERASSPGVAPVGSS